MKQLFLFIIFLSVIPPATAFTNPKPLVFTHVTVIDATGAPAQNDMVVVIKDNKIIEIGKFGRIKIPNNSQIIDSTGKFLIPGLWDMHVHLAKAGENTLPLFIVNGVTSVRDMGGDYEKVLRWRKEALEGRRISPRIKTAGAILESAKNVERMKREGTIEPVEKTRIGIATPEQAREAVKKMADLGADFIKVRTIETPEIYSAIAEEAKANGLMLVGHQYDSVETMVNAGQKSIEHLFFPPIIGRPNPEAIYKKLAGSTTYHVPTISVAEKMLFTSYDYAKTVSEDREGKIDFRRKFLSGYLIEDWKEQVEEKKETNPADLIKFKPFLMKDLQEMRKAGIKLMPGTDVAVLMIFPGYSLHDELQYLVEYAALSPMESIISATRYPAEFFGLEKTLGTIEKGKTADLILLDANPLEQITNTRKIYGIVTGGRYFDKARLEKILQNVQAQIKAGDKGAF